MTTRRRVLTAAVLLPALIAWPRAVRAQLLTPEQAAQRLGAELSQDHRFSSNYIRRRMAFIERSPALRKAGGATAEQVDAAVQFFKDSPQYWQAHTDWKNALKNPGASDSEKEALFQRQKELYQTLVGDLSGTGELEPGVHGHGALHGNLPQLPQTQQPPAAGEHGAQDVITENPHGAAPSVVVTAPDHPNLDASTPEHNLPPVTAVVVAPDPETDLPASPAATDVSVPPEQKIFMGQAALQQNRPAEALKSYRAAVAEDPTNPDAFSGLSSALYHSDNFAGAAEAASQALKLNPNDQNALAVLHLSQDRIAPSVPKPALSFSDKQAPEGAPGAGAASAAAAAAAAPAGVTPGAVERRDVAHTLRAAKTAIGLKDLDSALNILDRALGVYPKNAALLGGRSDVRERRREYALAEADARAALASNPRDEAAFQVLGVSQLRLGDYEGAAATAEAYLKAFPASAFGYALRAHVRGSRGDRQGMLTDLIHAATLDSSYSPIVARLAVLPELPSERDMLFLFPGEESARPAAAAPTGRVRTFGWIFGASLALGGLLALALLRMFLEPAKRRAASLFTRRTVGAGGLPDADIESAPVLISGRFQLGGRIGAGGMGMVFDGTDRSLGRRVAIKKMRDELRANPRERARFVLEAKTVAALHHDNIVDIYAIAEEGEDVYLVFEHVDGKTVHELLQAKGPLALRQAARIVRSAADALDFAHARGVVHRDMKPSNVMIDSTGCVKVMDFGIARLAKDSMTRRQMTNTVVGTPAYMAPEQEQGEVRRESDVYALAVCAYEMLTGRLPFAGLGAGMLMNKIDVRFVAPSRAAAGVPEALDAVFAKALQADPDKRYRTPKDFADALESALPSSAPVA